MVVPYETATGIKQYGPTKPVDAGPTWLREYREVSLDTGLKSSLNETTALRIGVDSANLS